MSRICLLVLTSFCLLSAVACKTTKERTEEQSKTQNVLTNYVKTPMDRAKDMKGRAEAVQKGVDRQAQQAAEGE